ncbi:MAG: DUF3048 domain-containing protein [Chloroflexi bacterium]|nr:DUF3048 domain-containing protein [Chloroflexota bacterium]
MRVTLPSWLAHSRRRQAIAGGAAVFLTLVITVGVLAAAGVFSGGSSQVLDGITTPESTLTPTPSPTPPPTEPTLLNGRLVYPEELPDIESRLPLAVMFDNIVTARPQVGLERADLVFEAVAEGGITRFLGVFWSEEPGSVLAVRSARVYYLDWAAGLDAIYVHWGMARSSVATADVPSALSRLGLRNFDGFTMGGPYFSRAPDRLGPHDGIADTDALWELAADNGWSGPPQIEAWQFKEDEPGRAGDAGATAAPTIDIGFGGPFFSDYAVTWEHDPKTNGYLRSQGGAPHVDGGSGNRIQARNVAAVVTSVRSVGDGTSHLQYQTTGSGEAVVFQDGVAIPGTWSKPDEFSRIRFFDAEGNEIRFNRGQTWIEVLSFADPLLY